MDDALIIACDGLWDVIPDEWAAGFVRQARTAADAAVTLKNYAFAMGSRDNISVIVIKFRPAAEDVGLCPRNTVDVLEIFEEPDEEELPAEIWTAPIRRRYSHH
jgi:serine/threonine protein phosphatase PrpC